MSEAEKRDYGAPSKGIGNRGLGSGHRRAMFRPKAKIGNVRVTLKRLWCYLSKKKLYIISVFIMVIAATGANLLGPYLIGRAIDDYIMPGDFRGLLKISILMSTIYGLSALATWLQNVMMARVAQDTVQELRDDLFTRLQILPLVFFDTRSHGEIMSRVTNDMDNINNTLSNSMTRLFASFVTVLGTVIVMLYISPLLTLTTVTIVPIMVFSTSKIASRTRGYFLGQQEKLGHLNGIIEETISGQRVVKVFTYEGQVVEKFAAANTELRGEEIRAQIFSGIILPFMGMLKNLSFAIVSGMGGLLAVKGIITVGAIASFINYTRHFTRPLNEIANQFNVIQAGIAGAERVFEVIDEKPEIPDIPDADELRDVSGKVEFCDVSFGYKEGVQVLNNINLSVNPGETIALVGPTGAGKTTVVNLLTRFYDVDKGAIYIDDKDIRSVKRNSLREALGIVLQETHLFSETVMENIRFGNLKASDEEVKAAARMANAHHFICRLPQGYNTVLSEDGSNLSQGQRQLLSIARAILRDPPILILDEATSSVDTRTELDIQEAIKSLMEGRTSFVIAHRLSTIRDADIILFIDKGEIIERGSHGELLRAKGFYYDLYNNQFRSVS